MSGPRVSSGTESKQDYGTPADFLTAVERRFGPIAFDLAAHAGNKKHPRYYAPRLLVEGSKKEGTYSERPNVDPEAVALDALAQDWSKAADGLLWLNPEFGDIAPWAKKCAQEQHRGARVAMLVPAAVGANWYRDFVAPHSTVYYLNGRLCFDGKNLFPKDCLLAIYSDVRPRANAIWEWKADKIHHPRSEQ